MQTTKTTISSRKLREDMQKVFRLVAEEGIEFVVTLKDLEVKIIPNKQNTPKDEFLNFLDEYTATSPKLSPKAQEYKNLKELEIELLETDEKYAHYFKNS